jgi:HlyD family secretion protein
MNLSPAGEIQLVVQIDEKNLGLIALANKALAAAEAYPDKTFPAEVVYVSPAVNLQRGSMEVKLRVTPADAPAYLREDMTVSVDIEVARKKDAVVLPLRFVRDLEGAAPWVLKLDGGRARRQAVKIGLRGARVIEIAEGLSPGDRVVGPDAAVADGQRMRAAAHE